MIDSRYPNRWFGSNPQAISSQGKQLSAFNREVPKDWRSALGIAPEDRSAGTPSNTEDAAA